MYLRLLKLFASTEHNVGGLGLLLFGLQHVERAERSVRGTHLLHQL